MRRFPVTLSDLGTPGRDPDTGEKMLLFYGGPFSQWVACDLVIDGVSYNCAEQYMMAQKARFFQDWGALAGIMSTNSPAEQKRIGLLVKDFDKDRWDAFSRDVVRTASLHKFRIPEFRRYLMASGGRTIVEASPTDDVWGIKRSETDPEAFRRSAWLGTNWLGQVLMEVRTLLKKG